MPSRTPMIESDVGNRRLGKLGCSWSSETIADNQYN